MGILIGLSVVAMNNSQVDSRDSERKMDAEAIALYFESLYLQHNYNYPTALWVSRLMMLLA
jgi:hypothetical protein